MCTPLRDTKLQVFSKTSVKEHTITHPPSFFIFRAYKTIEDEDLRFPLIYGEGKKVRREVNGGVRGKKNGVKNERVHLVQQCSLEYNP